MTYDLLFPVRGDTLPLDHGYPLYAALSHVAPWFHAPADGVRFATVTGERIGPGRLELTSRSRLRLRTADTGLPGVLALAGASLRIGDAVICLGPPTVTPLHPAPSLRARVVTFRNGELPEPFLAAARDKLKALRIPGEPLIPLVASGPRTGEPQRRVVRVKGKVVVGYSLIVAGLTADESVRLQEAGLGGRTRMGCGFFLPDRPGG